MNDSDGPHRPIERQLAAPPSSASTTSRSHQSGGDKPSQWDELTQNRAAVLAILFGVTGVLGLPLLWINRSFTRSERILWAVVVTIYTAALVAVAAAIVIWAYRQIMG